MSGVIPFEKQRQRTVEHYLSLDLGPVRLQLERLPTIHKHFGERLSLPQPGETSALATRNAKISALCYDRVWDPTGLDVPDPIRFSGATSTELDHWWLTVQYLQSEGDDPTRGTLEEIEGLEDGQGRSGARALIEELAQEHGLSVVPVFETSLDCKKAYKPGNRATVLAVLSNLEIVDNESLTWSQVLEFRADRDARKKYRRLVHWLDKEMVGKPRAFIEDEIACRLDDYEWALKKHGIQTLLGTLQDMLDGKFLTGASLSAGLSGYLGGPWWSLLVSGALTCGKVAVSAAQRLLDREAVRHETNPEVSYVYELKKRFGKDQRG